MILDTDFLVAVIRKEESAINYIENNLENQAELCITHVNLWELYQGVFKSEQIKKNLEEISELINHFTILEFTKESALRFGKLINDLRKNGKQIGVMDTLIASLALEHGYKILTKNVKHFELTGVIVETW